MKGTKKELIELEKRIIKALKSKNFELAFELDRKVKELKNDVKK